MQKQKQNLNLHPAGFGLCALFIAASACDSASSDKNSNPPTDGTSNDGDTDTDTGGETATDSDSVGVAACDDPNLEWKTARKTWYESYPDPNSEECIEYNGCTWEGQFAACSGKKPESWVAEHNIASAFPDFADLRLHDLCLRKGTNTIIVTVLDTCADSDCDGCCTTNLGTMDQLIDLESYTNERWGVADGSIEWADLGPTIGAGCE